MKIRREIRAERKDVYTIYETKKELDQNDNIVEVDVMLKENTTINELQDEKTALENQIADLQKQIVINDEMQTMIINFVE
jgi:cell division protein FtsB